MRKYALLEDNIVIKIDDLDDEAYQREIHKYSSIIDVEDLLPQPSVGWKLVGNKIVPSETLSNDAKLKIKMDMRFKFGNNLADIMVKKMSIRNVELIALGQVMNINTVIANFSGIEQALRKCAIPTAKSGIQSLSSVYTEYSNEFSYALTEINNYLNIESQV